MTQSAKLAKTITALFSRGGGDKTISYLLAAVLAGGTRVVASAIVALFALAAAQTAQAAVKPAQGFYWTGLSGSQSEFNNTSCWKYYNGSKDLGTAGNPQKAFEDYGSSSTYKGFFRSDYDAVLNKTVTFSGARKMYGDLTVSAGASDSPYVFAATQSNYGLTSSSTLNIAETADGYLQINSGTYSFGHIVLGNGSGKTGVLTMNGGTLNILNNYARLGCAGGTGILTVKTGAVFDNCNATTGNGKNFTLGQEANSSGTLNVQGGTVKIGGFMALNYDADSKESHVNVTDGGVLEVNNIYLRYPGTSGGTLTIDGGKLKARADSSAFIGAHNDFNVYVSGNGATFDTAGYAITVAENLQSTGETAGGLAVTGEGSATFSAQGDLSGALTVGDGTTLHWFDQDGSVSASCGFTSLALGAGSTICLDGDATGVDALPATATTTATAENKANVVIDFSAIPATGKLFTLFPAADADAFNVSPMFGSLVLPHEVAVVNGNLVLTISADNYTWNGTQTNWGDADAWTKGGASAAWADGNNAIFNTANATATLAAAANPAKIDFNADATVNGSATLTVPVVSVVSSVAATITAPTSGALEKTGSGTLTLGSSRTDQTTLSEGTLKIASGATVDGTKLTLGTDAAKPVVFDYGAQTLTANPAQYLGAGMDVTLTNGMFAFTSEPVLTDASMPSTLTIAKDATLSTSERFVINTGTERTLKVDGGELDLTGLSSSKNAWIMQNSSGTLRIDATNALLKAYGYVFAGTGHGSAGLSPKLEWTVVDSTFAIAGNGLFLGNRGNQPMSIYPVTPQVTFAMTNSVFYTEKGFILGQNPTENKSQTAGWYIADFDHCTVTSKLCRVYGDRPANAIRFNGVTLVSNGNGDSWIDAIGFADGATPVVVGADGLEMDNNGYAMTVAANLGGTGALKKTGSGKLTIAKSQTSTGALSCEAGETFVSGGLTVNRPATVKDGTTLTVQATAQSSFASLAFESGSTLNIDSYAVGVTAIAATALALPDSGTVALKFNGGAFPTGRYAILEKAGITVADVDGRIVPSVSAVEPSWEVSGDTLYLVVKGANDCIWTGSGGNSRLGTAANWLGGNIPASGANVFIALAAAGEIECDIADFSPASITFQANSAAVTITGENAINAVVSVTNLSANSHTIDVPVYFAGDIQVKQAAMAEVGDLSKAHVTFAGGAYAAQGYALENGNSAAVYSRCIFGKYYLANGENAPWTATYENSSRRVCLADNSTLYIPYAGALTELYIGNNAHVDVGKMALSYASRVSYRNYGEMAVTNLTLTGTGDRFMGWNMGSPVFKFERIETSMTGNWCYFADGNAASRGVYYIGAGGLNFSSASATGSYCVGKDVANDAQTIRPWYSDFTIGDRGNNAACFVLARDVTFCTDDESGTGRTITMDAIARGYGAAPTITVSGSGTLRVNKSAVNTTEPPVVVTNTATLAVKPGAVFTTSEITVNAGAALQVAESGTVALGGGLALKSGAALAFNYTGRDEPVLDLTGKTVTFDEGVTTNVTVRISADAGVRAHGGANVLTTGGKFADAKVTLAEGAPDWVSGVAVENGEIVITVKPVGFSVIVR